MIDKFKFTPQSALAVGTQIHTAPEAFGKMMSIIKPRMAVAYHFFNDFDTANSIYERIRTTYDGPLSLSDDFMVWNVTKDEVRVRMAVTEERTWAPPLAAPPELPNMDDRNTFAERTGVPAEAIGYTDFIAEGVWDVDDVLRPIYEETGEAVGKEFPYPGDN